MSDIPFTTSALAKRLVTAGLGTNADATRIIQHYTSEGLLVPEGQVHTGTGKRRMYPASAFLKAAILFRLNRIGVPAGRIKELVEGLDQHTREHHGAELEEACRSLADPCLLLGIPDGPGGLRRVAQLVPAKKAYGTGDGDVIIIALNPYLKT